MTAPSCRSVQEVFVLSMNTHSAVSQSVFCESGLAAVSSCSSLVSVFTCALFCFVCATWTECKIDHEKHHLYSFPLSLQRFGYNNKDELRHQIAKSASTLHLSTSSTYPTLKLYFSVIIIQIHLCNGKNNAN